MYKCSISFWPNNGRTLHQTINLQTEISKLECCTQKEKTKIEGKTTEFITQTSSNHKTLSSDSSEDLGIQEIIS